jgi:hypothetical protein
MQNLMPLLLAQLPKQQQMPMLPTLVVHLLPQPRPQTLSVGQILQVLTNSTTRLAQPVHSEHSRLRI